MTTGPFLAEPARWEGSRPDEDVVRDVFMRLKDNLAWVRKVTAKRVSGEHASGGSDTDDLKMLKVIVLVVSGSDDETLQLWNTVERCPPQH